MKIIDQSHEVTFFSHDTAEFIERVARTCYKSEDRITEGSAEKMVKSLIKRGHMAMIEFGSAAVMFITDRGVTHELVRHRLCSFAQESTRYVNYKEGMEVIKPVWWEEWSDYKRGLWDRAMFETSTIYRHLIEDGATPQEARAVLPNSLKTEINVMANFREWRHIFELRCDKAAHPQIRALMNPLLKEFIERNEVVFGDLKRLTE